MVAADPADKAGVMPGTPVSQQRPLVHIGRQAIYDRDDTVVAYELLFRGASDAVDAQPFNVRTNSQMIATSQVIVNAFAEFGLDQLVGSCPCFINLTREFLVGDLPLPFAPEHVVLEVLETVAIDDEVVAGVARLVEQGFRIALDDFVWGQGHERLLNLASYVKIDLLDVDPQTVVSTALAVRRHANVTLVAERIETLEQLELAHKFGFDLFQGHTFGRPQTVSAATLNPSRLRRLELFGALTAVDIDINHAVEIVTTDPALSYRVLQATNSASTGLPRRVASVREAIMMLGLERIRQWVALMLVSDISEASDEQLTIMMSRAKLCQTVAERLDLPPDVAFTVGLLAGVAELIDEPVSTLVTRLPVTEEIVEALVDGRGRFGQVLSMVRAYERADMAVLGGAPVSSADLARAYLAAVGWSQKTVGGVMGGGASRRLPPAWAVKRHMS